MKYVVSFIAVLILCGQSFAADAHFTLVKLSRSTGDLHSQLQQQEQQAEKSHEKMFVQITADWCIHCRMLNASLNNSKMKDAFKGTYIVQVDADEWKDQLGSIGIQLNGIPAFYQISKDGLVTSYTINGGAWGEDTVANMAPPLKNYFSHAK